MQKGFSVLVVNCMSVSTGTAHSSSIMRQAINTKATIILASECRDFNVQDVDRRNLYWWHQPGVFGTSESGVLVGVRKQEGVIKRRRFLIGSKPTSEGDGIDMRVIAMAYLWLNNGMRFWAASGHAPPGRAPIARGRFLDVWAHVRAKIKGGDTNVDQSWAARLFRRKVVGSGVVYLTIPRDCKVVSHQSLDLSGDHPAEYVELVKRKIFRKKKVK